MHLHMRHSDKVETVCTTKQAQLQMGHQMYGTEGCTVAGYMKVAELSSTLAESSHQSHLRVEKLNLLRLLHDLLREDLSELCNFCKG